VRKIIVGAQVSLDGVMQPTCRCLDRTVLSSKRRFRQPNGQLGSTAAAPNRANATEMKSTKARTRVDSWCRCGYTA